MLPLIVEVQVGTAQTYRKLDMPRHVAYKGGHFRYSEKCKRSLSMAAGVSPDHSPDE